MKKLLAVAILAFLSAQAFAGNGPSYRIEIKIKGMRDSQAYLAYYMGDKTYLADSAIIDSKGVAIFSRDTVLGCGIYMFAVNRAKLFEFVVSEQNFTLETDTANLLMNMKVKDSKDNEAFFEFQQYSYRLGLEDEKLRTLQKQWATDATKKDTLAKINERLKTIPRDVYNYRSAFMKKYPHTVLTKVFKALAEPDVPEPPKDANGHIDSNWQYYYYQNHYWDSVDFESGCVLRSPIYLNKLTQYMENGYQHPDSLYATAVKIIDKTKANKEMFRFTLVHLINTYAKSKYVCMDGIRTRLELKYYNYTDCFWLDSTEIYRTRANAETNLPTLCFLYAPRLDLYDTTTQRGINKIILRDTNEDVRSKNLGIYLSKIKTVNLYDIKSNYTVILFWTYDCSHCQKEVPVISSFYDTIKARGVEVYAVCTGPDVDKWTEFIHKHNLHWINVCDGYDFTNYHKYYNVVSTPQVFLLDKNKMIIAKRLGAENLKEILYHDLGLPYTKPANSEEDDSQNPHQEDAH